MFSSFNYHVNILVSVKKRFIHNYCFELFNSFSYLITEFKFFPKKPDKMYCSPDKGQHYTVLSPREDISSTKLKLNKQKIIKHTSNLNLQGRRSFRH